MSSIAMDRRTSSETVDRETVEPPTPVTEEKLLKQNELDQKTPQVLNEPGVLEKMGGGKEFPPLLPDKSVYQVGFEGPDDPLMPENYPLKRKIIYMLTVTLVTLSVAVGSAIFSLGASQVSMTFHVGPTVSALGTALFIFGFAAGPVVWGPLSELFGRKSVLVVAAFIYSCFCFACAVSMKIESVIITRFFQGLTGSALLVVVPAVISDLFNVRARGLAISIFSTVLFGGPFLAPIIGGFIVKNESLGWRWTQYITGIISAAAVVLVIIIYEETHPPTILKYKAQRLREATGNWGIRAPIEDSKLDIKNIIQLNISRPLRLLITEPIILLISVYAMFIYGLLYMFLTIIPLIFEGQYHFSPGVAELPYIALFIGFLIGVGISVFCDKRFLAVMDANNGKAVPEERLISQMVGSIAFPIGLFWLGWAGNYADKVHWIVPTLGGLPIGIGLITIFLPCFTYIIDCYLVHAASALASMALVRSAFAGACPLFARQMFDNMGIQWASTLLGCVSAALIPIPYLFYKYGAAIRRKSKYAFE